MEHEESIQVTVDEPQGPHAGLPWCVQAWPGSLAGLDRRLADPGSLAGWSLAESLPVRSLT